MSPLRTLIAARKPEILAIARRYGVSHLRLFGSVARGDEGEESDIDLLIDLASDRGLLALSGFRREVQELLGRPVDVATEHLLKDRIRPEVLCEATPL